MSSVTPYPGVYNSSITPAGLPWDTYNYCNSPHVNGWHYEKPFEAKDAELVFVNVVQRHHKRTPDNLYPNEIMFNPPSGWDCSNYKQISYGVPASYQDQNPPINVGGIYRKIENPTWHPLTSLLWNGTCDQGMLTLAGLQDSFQHGKDFWSVYGPGGKNVLLKNGINEREVYFRTSNADRTYQVSGGLLAGMGHHEMFPVHTMPSVMDDIVPNYACPYADSLRSTEQSQSNWTGHLKSQQSLFDSLNKVVGTGNLSAWNSWIDHHYDAMASRQCHGHDLPSNPKTGQSISQDLANQAYNEGHWEYDYIWNSGSQADNYVRYGFGVFVQELARNLQRLQSGQDPYKLKWYVGHDGTMVRLFKSLAQKGQIKWPAMGSEIVLEVYKQKQTNNHFVRILQNGKTMQTTAQDLAINGSNNSTDGSISWTPLEKVISYLNARVPSDLYSKCVLGQ